MDNGADCSHSKSSDGSELGELDDMPDSHAAIQIDLNRLEKWSDRKFMKLNKNNCKILQLEGTTPCTSMCWEHLSWKAA